MLQILFAILAGILTIAAPCILPMLPILLGASVGQQSRQRPLFIVLGFIISFAAASLLLSIIIQHLGINPNAVRDAAIVLLVIFAGFMIWPKPFEMLTMHMSGTINKANQIGGGTGNVGGLLLGLILGIIWTPCAGPILGAILTLIATQGSTARSATLLVAYAIGAGVPMLIIAYGSQYITTKVRWMAQYSARLQRIFGILILLLAVAMYFQYDVQIENWLTAYFPGTYSGFEQTLSDTSGLTKAPPLQNSPAGNMASDNSLPLTTNPMPKTTSSGNSSSSPKPQQLIQYKDYGPAPDFTGIYHWLNSDPLTISQLRGKVVLVDFWTFSCINCIRTLPYVTRWYDTYKNLGFVVVGVHTPEFAFEKDTNNVADAIKHFNINYPVAQDNDYATWNAYNNEYWPAEYLINQQGEIVEENFGEGDYDHTENSIRQLLGLNATTALTSSLGNIESPEMYFEPSRLEYLAPQQQPSSQPAEYSLPSSLSLNNFALEGRWQFNTDNAALVSGSGEIELNFSSGKVYMVASADQPITLKITVDGQAQPDVTVSGSELYTLFDSNDYREHNIVIDIPQSGFHAFTFTFG